MDSISMRNIEEYGRQQSQVRRFLCEAAGFYVEGLVEPGIPRRTYYVFRNGSAVRAGDGFRVYAKTMKGAWRKAYQHMIDDAGVID